MTTFHRLAIAACFATLAGCATQPAATVPDKETGMDLEARTGSNVMHKVRRKSAEKPNDRDAQALEQAVMSPGAPGR